jgi:hypothetical protein
MAMGAADLRFLLTADVDLSSVRKSVDFVTKELQGPLGPIGLALGALPDFFRGLATSVVDFARIADPLTFQRWSRALLDVQGVIGRTFVPVLELMTSGVRLFGDVLANLLPSTGEVRDALGVLRVTFSSMAKEFRDLFAEIGPDVRAALIAGLKTVAHWIAVVTRALGLLAKQLAESYRGMFKGGAKIAAEPRTSWGAAAAPARITSFEEFEKSLQTAFASVPKDDPLQQAADDLDDLLDVQRDAKGLVDTINNWLAGVQSWVEKNWKDVSDIARAALAIAGVVNKVAGEKDLDLGDALRQFNDAQNRRHDLDWQRKDLEKKHPEWERWKRPF